MDEFVLKSIIKIVIAIVVYPLTLIKNLTILSKVATIGIIVTITYVITIMVYFFKSIGN